MSPRPTASIRSMTAYASSERSTPWGTLGCEIRAVNHRFLEPGFRLSEELRALEPAFRERLAQRLSRGKVDVGFRLRSAASGEGLKLNPQVLDQLSQLALDMSGRFPGFKVEFTELLRHPGLIEQAEVDTDALQAECLTLLETVLDDFVAAREREGAALAAAMRERLDGIERIVAEVKTALPEIRAALRARLDARIADLKQPLDPGRLEQELVLQLQKIDVDEELDRLGAHIAEMRRTLASRDAVGRRLDFLLQEFNREANTLGSKSIDARSSAASVELKVLIEQLREQVQNIE